MPEYKVMTVKMLVKEGNSLDVAEELNRLRDDSRLSIIEWVEEGDAQDITADDAADQFELPELRPKWWRVVVRELYELEFSVRATSESEARELAAELASQGGLDTETLCIERDIFKVTPQ